MTDPGLASATNAVGEAPKPADPAQRDATRWTLILADTTHATTTGETDLARRSPPGTGVLLFLGLLWLALTLWITYLTLSVGTDIGVVVSAAALALPSLVTAAIVAGAAAGLALASLADRRRPTPLPAGRRLPLGLAAGVAASLLAGGPVVFTYGTQPTILALALTVAAAAIIGGASAALPLGVLAAGIAGALGVLVEGVVVGTFQSPLKDLLGSGATAVSQFDSARNLAYLSGVLGGIVAALVAYLYLRRMAQRDAGGALAWPWFAFAGAFAGVLLLVGDVITRVGGASLFDRVRSISALDGITLSFVAGARLTQALLVLFVGAVGAMIAIGRTLRRSAEDDPAE